MGLIFTLRSIFSLQICSYIYPDFSVFLFFLCKGLEVLLNPTQEANPQFVTVSGGKGIYTLPFDLEAGDWTVAVKIDNSDPQAKEVLVVSLRLSVLFSS